MGGKIYVPEKTITIPVFDRVDVSDVMPIISHAYFQRLKYKQQLGLLPEVFIGGTHTRKLHSIATYHVAALISAKLMEKGFIEEKEAEALKVASLLHDLGQPPFCHAVEYVIGNNKATGRLGKTHNDETLRLIESEEKPPATKQTMKEAIEQCGVDYSLVIKILADPPSNHLHKIYHNKTIGADKIAYTALDPHFTNPSSQGVRLWDSFDYFMLIDGEYGIEEKIITLVKDLQDFYLNMYTEVYLTKAVLGLERTLQKALEFAIAEGEIEADEVWGMPEYRLLERLVSSQNKVTSSLTERITLGNKLKTATSLKKQGYAEAERKGDKPITVLEVDDNFVIKFLNYYTSPQRRTELERKICNEYGIDEDKLIITMVPNPEKLKTNDMDLNIYNKRGKLTGTLFRRYRDHKKKLDETVNSHFAIRIVVSEELRERTSRLGEDMLVFIRADMS